MLNKLNKVLILGCGTIGRIKSGLWLSLGMDVYLHDTSPSQVGKLLKTDVRLKRFQQGEANGFIVDISTPSDQHASSLQWAFEAIKNPMTVLVEKPICTNTSDKMAINRLLNKHRDVSIYVNESYFWSLALDWLLGRLHADNDRIVSIEVNLSKNRLADARAGRFFDRELESYGIEMPHVIAIIQKLGVDISRLRVLANTLYRSDIEPLNQGVNIELSDANGSTIKIDSFLGNFMILESNRVPNCLARWLIVKTDKQNTYRITFDPAPNERRFKSVVMINGDERIVLDDDHLRKHLQQIQFGEMSNAMKQYLSPANSIAIYDFLEKLYDSKIEDYISDTVVQNNEVGERVGVIQWH